jgi:polyisoprenoid-binding protein YceI
MPVRFDATELSGTLDQLADYLTTARAFGKPRRAIGSWAGPAMTAITGASGPTGTNEKVRHETYCDGLRRDRARGLFLGRRQDKRLRGAKCRDPHGNGGDGGHFYTLDDTHAFLVFRVNHLGLSRYTMSFTRFDAELQFDPATPSAMSVTATIDSRSIETDFLLPKPDLDAVLQGPEWLAAARFPEITFRSTDITLTGPDTARVTGEFGLHGMTRPVTLAATFNGGYAHVPYDPMGSRIGFSAKGVFKRSDFGITEGLPAASSTMGVGNEVKFFLEVEFTRPAPAAPKQGPR